ncbi:MAG: pilus assembly protein PilM, partial [Pedosphaera parvula]|nr:pilus assembly protein PilM [Pedosphaera parvula]
HLQRKGDAFALVGFVMQDAPIYDRALSAEVLADHLKGVIHTLGSRVKPICLAIGPGDSLLRHAELPMVPLPDMRQMLKFGSKNYLQQDLPDHLFDCYILASSLGGAPAEAGKAPQKCKVLVGGAKRQLVGDIQTAAKEAGLFADQITTSLVAPANAFELAMPEVYAKEVVALVDFGYKNSTISIMMMGELILSRVVGFGAAKLTTGIAESMGITNAEAENIKVGMPQEVESTIQPLLTPLGRELRASIDFFEHQQDKTVSQVFFSGGSARSDYVVQALQAELMVPCKSWNPTTFLTLSLPPQQMAELEQVAPQLTVAIGAAAVAF